VRSCLGLPRRTCGQFLLPRAGWPGSGVAALLHVEESRTVEVLREFRRVLCPRGALAVATASGENQGWETVPYAPLERRWFVNRRPERLRGQLGAIGFEIIWDDKVELRRLWWTCLAKAA
jgi:hypothetical protein